MAGVANTAEFTVHGESFIFLGELKKFLNVRPTQDVWEIRLPVVGRDRFPRVIASRVGRGALAGLLAQCNSHEAPAILARTLAATSTRPVIRRLYLNITLECNLRCRYCYVDAARRGLMRCMPWATAVRAVDWLLGQGDGALPMQIRFFGGEPLACPDLLRQIVEYCQHKSQATGLRVEYFVSTNGTLLDGGLAQFFKTHNVHLKISLDGTQKLHDANRVDCQGKGSYEATLRGLRAAQDAGLRPTVCITADGCLGLDVGAVLGAIRALGVQDVQWQSAVTDAPSHKPQADCQGQVPAELTAACAWDALLHGDDCYLAFFADGLRKMFDRERALPGCGAGLHSLMVAPDGDLYFCQRFLGHKEFVVGNVHTGCNYEKLAAMLAGIFQAQTARCKDCWLIFLCPKGCYYENYRARGAPAAAGEETCRSAEAYFRAVVWLGFKLAQHFPAKLREILTRKTYLDADHARPQC